MPRATSRCARERTAMPRTAQRSRSMIGLAFAYMAGGMSARPMAARSRPFQKPACYVSIYIEEARSACSLGQSRSRPCGLFFVQHRLLAVHSECTSRPRQACAGPPKGLRGQRTAICAPSESTVRSRESGAGHYRWWRRDSRAQRRPRPAPGGANECTARPDISMLMPLERAPAQIQ